MNSVVRFRAFVFPRAVKGPHRCQGWDWRRKASGMLDIRAVTLATSSPLSRTSILTRLQSQVAELRLSKLLNTLGEDGFSRCSLKPFWTLTSRNLPQGERDEGTGTAETVFLLSLPAWLRGLVRPPKGWAVVVLDFIAQEVLIAAGLSGDPTLIEDAQTDPYLRFAERANLIPKGADPADPAVIRAALFARCVSRLAIRTDAFRSRLPAWLLRDLCNRSAANAGPNLPGVLEVVARYSSASTVRFANRFAVWVAAARHVEHQTNNAEKLQNAKRRCRRAAAFGDRGV